ncbi:MAG: hypothetical protein Tsb009_27850 [Planctomycetaceae bacterium]
MTVSLFSTDTTEGTVPANVVFTPTDFAPKKFRITPVDDGIEDGTQEYTVRVTAAASFDLNYNGINPEDVHVTNVDRIDTNITPVSGLQTTEAGGTATFTIRLTSKPEDDVKVFLTSSDTTEGVIASANPVVFTPDNWNVSQTVTVRGVDDSIDDGDVAYQVLTSIMSNDPSYAALDPPDISLVNIDDDETIVPPGNVRGIWRGPARQCNPLSCLDYTMTLNITFHIPEFNNIITGTISDGTNTRNFFGTVAQDTGRVVINVNTENTFFIRWQLVGTATPSRMSGTITIQDRFGGLTTGNFSVNRITTGLTSAETAIPVTSTTTAISSDQLQAAFADTIANGSAAGLTAEEIRRLEQTVIQIADLPGELLGFAEGNTITIDHDAAGFGWFVDTTPFDSSEFSPSGTDGTLQAVVGSEAYGRFDLLTVIAHELGHVLGHEHDDDASSLMSPTLQLGTRHSLHLDDLFRIDAFDELSSRLEHFR